MEGGSFFWLALKSGCLSLMYVGVSKLCSDGNVDAS